MFGILHHTDLVIEPYFHLLPANIFTFTDQRENITYAKIREKFTFEDET